MLCKLKRAVVLCLVVLGLGFSFSECFAESGKNAACSYKKISADLKGIKDMRNFCSLADAALKGEWKSNKDKVKELISQNRENIARFKQAALLENYDVSYGEPENFYQIKGISLPSYQDELILARMALLQAELFCDEERFAEALENYLSVLKLAEQIRSQRTLKNLTSSVVSLVLQNMAFTTLAEFIKNDNMQIQIYQKLLSDLGQFNKKDCGLQAALEGEFEFLDKTLPVLREISRKELVNLKNGTEKEKFLDEMIAELQRLNTEARGYILISAQKNDLAYYNDKVSGLLKKTESKLRQQNINPQQVREVYAYASNDIHTAPVVGKILFLTSLPYYGKIITKHYVRAAKLKLLETACAIKIYKMQNNALPPTLNNLVPAYLAEIPGDDFAKPNPVQYNLTQTNCIVYSIGPDGIDDQAKKAYTEKGQAEDGDIILEVY